MASISRGVDDSGPSGAPGDIPLVPVRSPRDVSPVGAPAASESGGSTSPIIPPAVESCPNASEQQLQNALAVASGMTLDELLAQMREVVRLHKRDPNYPRIILDRVVAFLALEDDVKTHPEQYAEDIYEHKVEMALIVNTSPYSSVRAIVPNVDDPSMPCSTIRAWFIGMLFSCILAVFNQLFSIRMPPVTIGVPVAQLLAYPLGKLCERVLPDRGFTLGGVRHSLNPGPFNRKEHILITIMASAAYNLPYSNNVIWIQYLEQFLNQQWAGQYAYQILLALSTNFIGYGFAGVTRQYLVYPAYCLWPSTLAIMAANAAFHINDNSPVKGPWKTYTMTRYKFFMLATGLSFIWYWVPGFLVQPLSYLGWMAWIDPNNLDLSAITGFSGLGINPFPTLDWNVATHFIDPLVSPPWMTLHLFGSMVLSSLVVAGMWYHNSYYTAYSPIMTNLPHDNTGQKYDLKRIVNNKGTLLPENYEGYSPVFLSAGQLVAYFCYFAMYPATLMNAFLEDRHSLLIGFKALYRSFWSRSRRNDGPCIDVHSRLMAKYAEVPQLWFVTLLVLSVMAGEAAIMFWDTDTTGFVVFYGLALCAFFVVPFGIIKAITAFEVTLNVLAEFIGGYFVNGNTLALNFFKTFGYVTCSQALAFASDMKLAHYAKIPPRQTFCAQVMATLVSTLICTGLLNFQLRYIPNVCTPQAPDDMSCPGINTFFTSAVVWGTIGPVRLFSAGEGAYARVMLGWVIGAIVPVVVYGARKLYPRSTLIAKITPFAVFSGGMNFAPYNISYLLPAVPLAMMSWKFVRPRWGDFWDRYNYLLSSALTTGVALAIIIIFFALDWHRDSCEGSCLKKEGRLGKK
ncbi:OPT oligopeptide transporter domain containing protein [Naviculisporaceae sp. PSN 640]